MVRYVLLTVALASCVASVARAEVRIGADYPGGNIVVERIDGDVVYLHQDLRDTEGWWFYWSFEVRGAAERTMTFRFTNRNVIGTRGPAVSLDEGLTWSWLGNETVGEFDGGVEFTYSFSADQEAVRFAFAMPYQRSDLDRFLAPYAGNKYLETGVLASTRNGRDVTRLRVGAIEVEPRYRIMLTARHHSCESMASYIVEGILQSILADTEDGAWFRENVEVLVIPLMDTDGVEDGDQGKNRKPRDHGRDYEGESIYPEVAALRAFVPEWSSGRLRIAMDIHCPYIRGEHNEVVYLVGSSDPGIWEEQQRFSRILESLPEPGLPFRSADNLPFGTAWNTGANYTAGTAMPQWAAGLDGVHLATAIEVPYANVGDTTVTPANARAFGHALATAMRRYLEIPSE
ncbi:MAG: hypothetical protein AMXMBFR82_21800 [Candidatus Hydrogenedentota bacterium]